VLETRLEYMEALGEVRLWNGTGLPERLRKRL
jgi:hypothetical protein